MNFMRHYLNSFFHLHNPLYNFYSVIIFVTSRCNSRCIGCLYEKKNKTIDMSLADIQHLSRQIGNVWHLQISGGEPFLRCDLDKICRIFINNNKTRLISIPTNGSLPHRIKDTMSDLLINEKCNFIVGVSIDGTDKVNRQIRGLSVHKCFQSLKILRVLENNHSNIIHYITTRILKDNISDIQDLDQLIKSRFSGIFHEIIPIRGQDPAIISQKPTGILYNQITKKIHLPESFLQKIRRRFITKQLTGEKWPFRCIAGKKMCVVDSDGDIRLCELLAPIGNIRNSNFEEIWISEIANNQREKISSGECSKGCTHGCFIVPSILNNPWSIFELIR